MRRRISEAGVFELIKRKFPDDLWQKQTAETEESPQTWGLLIQTEAKKAGKKKNVKEYQVLRYADKTLCSMEINEEDQVVGNHRPTPQQLEQLLDFVINLK